VLVFFRNIKNLEPVLKNSEEIKMKQRFIEFSGQEIDPEAKKMLNRLRDKIKKNVLPQNLHELTVSFKNINKFFYESSSLIFDSFCK